MLKYKNFRESFGGFPTRCVGCLLAVILLLSPFTAFAFQNTTSQSDDFTSQVPSVAAIASEAYVNNENTLLFWDKTNNIYYLCTQDDYITKGYNFQVYGEPDGSRLYGAFALTPNMASDLKVYRYNPSIDSDWTQITLPYNSIGYYSYFDIGTFYLYAFLPIHNIPGSQQEPNQPPTVISNGRAMLIGLNDNSYGNINIFTKYNIDSSTFELSNYTPEDEAADEQSNFWSGVLKWLKQIRDNIVNLASNLWNNYLSQPFSTITTSLSNIGSTIWNAIKAPFGDTTETPPNGGLLWRMWQSIKAPFEAPDGALYNLPAKIWNAIKAPFGDTTETPPNGGLLWRMWQSIKAPFVEGGVVYEFVNDLIDDIKSLFVPDAQFLSTYKTNWTTMLSTKFGGAYQVLELSHDLLEDLEPLFDFEEVTNFTVEFPQLRFPMRFASGRPSYVNLISAHTVNFDEVFTPQDFGGFNFWTFWRGFIYFTTSLSLLYFCRREFHRVIGSLQGGSDT